MKKMTPCHVIVPVFTSLPSFLSAIYQPPRRLLSIGKWIELIYLTTSIDYDAHIDDDDKNICNAFSIRLKCPNFNPTFTFK